MKKTVSVSLNGSVFILDEDAYQILENYLGQLNRHFAGEEGRQEIIADIEARMAEHLKANAKVEGRAVGVDEVNRVIEIMGKPSDFGNEQRVDGLSCCYRRMYRDLDGKIFGGVCAGMGHYWRVEPVLFRIVFVLTLFFGGLGLLIYLILWVVVPPALTATQKLEMRGKPVNAQNIGKSFDRKS